ncbi:hypothetical protein [Bosea sp. (in: a-proteobacteria)]|mgnify:CR=1 FL=1|uniref:hypothetical protein n=1 Tax=Bosea sp. (in: a-proteobacteria) TaxID=1871050 RepID=UPI001AC1438E|nr:hypothetical protein [Bosea sp. (in: a-proteobacteria)]MBN9438508.1 hypothetical protein [Bosea sp. (in: a-proteobacteria)]
MTVWIIAKPRLRFYDAIDVFMMRLADLPGSRSFVMKPSYVSSSGSMNHDELFAKLMTGDAAKEDPFVENFLEIFNSQTARSQFSPLVTNRLLSPILPRDIEPGAPIRRKLRNRLENLLGQLRGKFNGKLNCLIMLPNASDYATSVRLGSMLADGYPSERAEAVVASLTESLNFSEYKIMESGVFDEVRRVVVPTGASFSYLYWFLKSIDIPLPGVIPTEMLKPTEILDFYMFEALMSRKVRGELISARPSQRSRSALEFRSIIEALAYTHKAHSEPEPRHLEALANPEIDTSRFTLLDAIRMDDASRQNFLWRAGDQ